MTLYFAFLQYKKRLTELESLLATPKISNELEAYTLRYKHGKNRKLAYNKKCFSFSGLLDKITNILLGRVKRFVDFNLLHTPGSH